MSVVNRIAFDDAECGLGMSNAHRIVQRHDGIESGKTGRDHLRASAESGEEMRLDKTRGDLEIRFDPPSIEKHAHAGTGETHIDERCIVARVMTNNATRSRKLCTDHLLDFRIVISPVSPCCDKDRDVISANVRHFRKQSLEHQLAWLRASDIAHGNSDLLSPLDEFPQRPSSHWRRDRLSQHRDGIRSGRDVKRFDHGCPLFGKVNHQPIGAVV